MPAEPKFTRCDECGVEFQYTCRREIYCPACNHWMEFGHECKCKQCRAERDDNADGD